MTLGWDERSYKEFSEKFGWQQQDIDAIKELRTKFIELQNKTWR
jgi:hypothetical protein